MLSAADQRASFIFELTNIIQTKKHLEVCDAAVKGEYRSAEEYAQAMELTEYEGLKRIIPLCRIINQQKKIFFRNYINHPMDSIPVENMGFDRYYSMLADDHKEHYRKYWRSLDINKPYLIKNTENKSIESSHQRSGDYKNNLLGVAFFISGFAIALFPILYPEATSLAYRFCSRIWAG